MNLPFQTSGIREARDLHHPNDDRRHDPGMESCVHEGSIHLRMDARRWSCCCSGPGPLRCVAQSPASPAPVDRRPPAGNIGDRQDARDLPQPSPPPLSTMPGRRVPAVTPPSPLATHLELKAAPVRSDRPPVPDQPRHRAAALRRPAADRRRGAGQRLGRRGRADAGQGPLDPRAQHRLRLHPPRRRRPGLQQGHHDRAQHQLLLRRCRPVGQRRWGSSPRPMPSTSPWSPGRS